MARGEVIALGRRVGRAVANPRFPGGRVTYGDYARTGKQDCENVIDLDQFDLRPGRSARQIVDAAFAGFEEDGLRDAWMEQNADNVRENDLDPAEAYEAWKSGWKGRAVTFVADQMEDQRAARENPPTLTTGRLVVTREKAPRLPKTVIYTPEHAVDVAFKLISNRAYEVFLVMYLDAKNQLLGYEELTEDSISGVSVNVPSLLRNALLAGALGLVTAHNHPSSVVDPSAEDRSLWSEIREMGALMKIAVLDNLVIGDLHYFSESENGTGRRRSS